MWLEDLLSLVLYAPLLLPVLLLFVYAFAEPKAAKPPGLDIAEPASGPLPEPDH
jgi:ABC-type spermidine/putrescine transport system permease subunit II